MDISQTEYYADPSFTVFKVPQWRAFLYKFLSVNLWGGLPSGWQRRISRWYAGMYSKPISKQFIKPYIRVNYKDKNYLAKFKPPNGKPSFANFQDFFTREFKTMPVNESDWVWPCEGLLCEESKIKQIKSVQVKSDVRHVHTVFGVEEHEIPETYSFTNVFLHNKNYHRIHAPVDGTITRIQHIPGDLVVLRPWIYKQNPSLPAFRNERYNIDMVDTQGRTWFLSIIGGPAVGTIALNKQVVVGNKMEKLGELALFYLGSTCCMAAPIPPRFHTQNSFVEVGAGY